MSDVLDEIDRAMTETFGERQQEEEEQEQNEESFQEEQSRAQRGVYMRICLTFIQAHLERISNAQTPGADRV